MQQQLMTKFYKKINIDPKSIEFIEAHSTGTQVGDPQEVKAIDEVFSKGQKREKSLLIGSVKSNIGHTEASAAVASIAKILITFENKRIPPNINITKPRSTVAAFNDGRIKVVTETEKLTSNLISMNSFGVGGANAHFLFEGNTKEKINLGIPCDNLERLVLWSGRTEEAVNSIFDDITQRPLDIEFIGLLQNSQSQTTLANIYRGYAMFSHDQKTSRAVCVQRDVKVFTDSKPPVVWVFSGMGSQWIGMASDLMRNPTFAASIRRSHDILLTKGLDLKYIITSDDQNIFENALNSYVGIIAIEIALIDVLKNLGLKPDFIIGHSVGEVGCAYADECFSTEETILTAYYRGVAAIESATIKGAMAAVGLHHKKLKNLLPQDIDIACHNGSESATVSGPAESVTSLTEKLKEEKIFAKEVSCSNVPFHSRYIVNMGKRLLTDLKTVIKSPKKRSPKWLSSSFQETSWNEVESQYSSAEYHTKNLLNPVLFEEVCQMLPSNSLTIEIGPCGLLQSILRKSFKGGSTLSLLDRGNPFGSLFMMNSFGK